MTKTVQHVRGPFEEQSVYTGPAGEITIDETNDRILIHDGETPGGRIFISRDEGDTRWMQHIAELLGFANFGMGVKGFAVRQAAGVWTIRTITGNANSIEITEGFGETGNPVIELADNITKDLTFSGDITFDSIILGLGFIGDTQGDHTGNVLGNLTGDTLGIHTGDSFGTHTGPQIGAVDARGESIQVDADSIPISAVAGLQAAIDAIPAGVPIGTIVDWWGNLGDIPAGWALCDGTNGTPDLRGRFTRGAGDTGYPTAHDTGGNDTHSPAGLVESGGAHTHSGAVGDTTLTLTQIPPHEHGSGVCDNVSNDVFNHSAIAANPTTANSIESNSADGIHEGKTTTVGGSGGVTQPHNHGLGIDTDGVHVHAFNGTEADYLPPYYALCKIMKV